MQFKTIWLRAYINSSYNKKKKKLHSKYESNKSRLNFQSAGREKGARSAALKKKKERLTTGIGSRSHLPGGGGGGGGGWR